jgi:hypothetical protein
MFKFPLDVGRVTWHEIEMSCLYQRAARTANFCVAEPNGFLTSAELMQAYIVAMPTAAALCALGGLVVSLFLYSFMTADVSPPIWRGGFTVV